MPRCDDPTLQPGPCQEVPAVRSAEPASRRPAVRVITSAPKGPCGGAPAKPTVSHVGS